MKLSELLTKLEASPSIEGVKAIVINARGEIVDFPDMDLKEYGARIKAAESDASRLAELTTKVSELDGKVKEAEPLKGIVAEYQKRDSETLLKSAFMEKALANGINKTAIDTAFKLANLEGVTVDLTKKAVVGLNAPIFENLKTDHAILFQKPTIPPPPTNGNPNPSNAENPAVQGDNWMAHLARSYEMRMSGKD